MVALAIACTTVAGPAAQSPMTYTFFTFVSNVAGLYCALPFPSSAMPDSTKRSVSIFSPIDAITVSAGMSTNSPDGTGFCRPSAPRSPSFIFSQRKIPFSYETGASSSLNSTPSSKASSSSSASAGINCLVLRYTIKECSTPFVRFATRAASIAVFPAPRITTFFPSLSVSGACFACSRNSITFAAVPFSNSSALCFHAPIANTTWVKPCFFSASTERCSLLYTKEAPKEDASSISCPIDAAGILNSGMTYCTIPPARAFFSNTVTSAPSRVKK